MAALANAVLAAVADTVLSSDGFSDA